MDDNARAVAETYNQDAEREWQRLAQDPYHALEFQVVMHHLRTHLPPSGKILDAGGGPGRYAIELCRAGHGVVLLDLSSGNIALAREKFSLQPKDVQDRLLEAVVGDIRDLSRFEADSFDAALCLNPLTYLSDQSDREKAITELARVVKPSGVISIGVRGYLALFRTILKIDSDYLLNPEFETLLETGDTQICGVTCHFFRAGEVEQLAEACGLTTVAMAGCEGISNSLDEATNLIAEDEAKWKRWVDLVLETSTEPAVVDTASHILYIGRKPRETKPNRAELKTPR
jgi:SAM-dependent methyltransferase